MSNMFGVLRPASPGRDNAGDASLSSPAPNSLAPMPDADFASREDLLAGTKAWAAGQGFAVVIARSRFNRLWLKCDRGGSYENRRQLTSDQRKRKRGESRLLGCPYKMIANHKKDGTWHVITQTPEHNHGPSDDLTQHPTLRKMTEEQLQKVHDMSDSGSSPSETIGELRRIWPDIKVLTRDIYNARKKHKSEKEAADAAAGLSASRPYQDPNGIIPGPDDRGRWAWVPDGEEVTNKKGKRKRRTATASQTALDPQLQTPHRPVLEDSSRPNGNQQLLDEFQNGIQSLSFPQQPLYSGPDTATSSGTDYMGQPHYIGGAFNHSPSRLRPQGALATASISPARSSTDHTANNLNTAAQRAPNGQFLMSRMERMEKEQEAQKNMLAQILGAVSGRSGNQVPNQ